MTPISRHLKVFISSTFQDMQDEREILLKDTFLALKKIAKSRAVEITEIDLRTGITQEQEQSGDIVKICLDEIERCADSPIFFLGMLGNRYGWDEWHKHTNKETLEDHKYSWVNEHIGCSVTELEILSAIENSSDNRAFLFLKESKDSDDKRLIELKHSLTQKASNSNLLVTNYKDKNEFRDKTIETFTKALDELYPEDEKPTETERLRATHQSFAKSRQKVYISHPKNRSILDEFIAGEQDRLLLYGESGYGKSALIANYFEEFTKNSDSFVIEHYIGGAGEHSNDLHQMLRRVMLEIKEEFELEEAVPTEPQKIMDEFTFWLYRVKRPTIIVFDGYNQIADELKEKLCYYIPDKLEQVKIIISSIKKDYPIENSYQIEALNQEEQRELIISYLKAYGKTISKSIQNKIIKHPQTDNTLFLRTLLNEIRLLGSFDNLDKDIANYLQARDVVGLFIKIFERLESDYKENLAKEVLSLLYVSRDGLSENNLMEIINENSTEKLTRLEFSPLFLAVEEHLIDRGGLYGFFHGFILESVEKRYLNSDELIDVERRKIADYFERREIDNQRVRELPFQLFEVDNKYKLHKNLLNIDFFEALYENNKYELLKYVQLIAKKYDFSEDLMNSFLEGKLINGYILNILGNFFYSLYIDYKKALLFYKLSLDYEQQIPTSDYEQIIKSYNNLSLVSNSMGQYKYALSFSHKALRIGTIQLGINHKELITIHTNLSTLYVSMDDLKKALFYSLEALNIGEEILNSNSKTLGVVYNNLAIVYFAIDENDKAFFYHQKSLNISKKVLGENHPETAISYANLAELYVKIEEYDKALLYYRKSLNINKKILGENHLQTAYSYSGLGDLYQLLDEYDKALYLFNKELEITKRVYGEIHLATAKCYNAIGILFQKNGDYKDALFFTIKALKIKESVLREKHSEIAKSYSSVALIYRLTEDYEQALFFYKKALKIYEELLGLNHTITASTYSNIAIVYQFIGKYEKALSFYIKALKIEEKILGENHSKVAITYNNLAELYRLVGMHDEALSIQKKVLNSIEDSLGYYHSTTASMYNNLAVSYGALNDYKNAYTYMKIAVDICKTILPKNHPDLIASKEDLIEIEKSLNVNSANSEESMMQEFLKFITNKINSGQQIDVNNQEELERLFLEFQK